MMMMKVIMVQWKYDNIVGDDNKSHGNDIEDNNDTDDNDEDDVKGDDDEANTRKLRVGLSI